MFLKKRDSWGAEALFIQAGRVWRGKEGLNLSEMGKWAWKIKEFCPGSGISWMFAAPLCIPALPKDGMKMNVTG